MPGSEYVRLNGDEDTKAEEKQHLAGGNVVSSDFCDEIDGYSRISKDIDGDEPVRHSSGGDEDTGLSFLQSLARQYFKKLDFDSIPRISLYRRTSSPSRVLAYILCVALIGLAYSVWELAGKDDIVTSKNCASTSDWNGWPSIKYAYIL